MCEASDPILSARNTAQNSSLDGGRSESIRRPHLSSKHLSITYDTPGISLGVGGAKITRTLSLKSGQSCITAAMKGAVKTLKLSVERSGRGLPREQCRKDIHSVHMDMSVCKYTCT